MSTQMLTVSPSPHIHQADQSVHKLMYGVLIALVPAFLVSLLVFGLGALKVTLAGVFFCMLFEYLICKFMLKREPSLLDGSAIITGVLLAFNLPSSLPIWAIAIGSLVAIGIGKMAFGGLGNNPFNPALVGRVFLLISFPIPMTNWPIPLSSQWLLTDAATGATPLALIKEGVDAGVPVSELLSQVPSYLQFFIGAQGGCIGEVSGLALLIGFLYMLYKKIITWHTPLTMIATVFVLTSILWLINPETYIDPVFHVITGGLLLGAFFMATDYVTSPMTHRGMIIYGIGIGLLTVIIRVWGAYPEGISFAILIMNGFVPLINKYVRPKKFGAVKVA
ncbi:MAG: RnfABCDGE type electron transport complex subunit D [Cyclobacteriaceae bacterium]